ncbi:hypothetical protein D3C87_1820760 [compost metagenome]
MDGTARDLVTLQRTSQLAGRELGFGEHNHLLVGILLEQLNQETLFLVAVYQIGFLFHIFIGGIAARHFDQRWIIQESIGQLLDLVRKCG